MGRRVVPSDRRALDVLANDPGPSTAPRRPSPAGLDHRIRQQRARHTSAGGAVLGELHGRKQRKKPTRQQFVSVTPKAVNYQLRSRLR